MASVTESFASAIARAGLNRVWMASIVSLISARVCSIWERMSSVVGAAAVAAVSFARSNRSFLYFTWALSHCASSFSVSIVFRGVSSCGFRAASPERMSR